MWGLFVWFTNHFTYQLPTGHLSRVRKSQKFLVARWIISLMVESCQWSCGGTLIWTHPARANYTPVNEHGNAISPFLIGNTSSNGPFSIAMLVYQRVSWICFFLCFGMDPSMLNYHFQPPVMGGYVWNFFQQIQVINGLTRCHEPHKWLKINR